MSRILVVDDEPQVSKALRRLLARAGHEVETVQSPLDALRVLDTFAPDLVISDFRMPEMTGMELLREVSRRRPACRRVLLSGYADVEALCDGQAHICRFYAKPWDTDTLLRELDALLQAVPQLPTPEGRFWEACGCARLSAEVGVLAATR